MYYENLEKGYMTIDLSHTLKYSDTPTKLFSLLTPIISRV